MDKYNSLTLLTFLFRRSIKESGRGNDLKGKEGEDGILYCIKYLNG